MRHSELHGLAAMKKHYFYGAPNSPLLYFPDPISYAPWREGLEYQTEEYDRTGTVMLRRVSQNWEQRVCGAGEACPLAGGYQTGPQPNDPRVTQRDTLLSDSGQISRQTFNYDRYNNELDRWEYDWGAGTSGALLRHTQAQYLWSSNSAYAAPGVNLLSLPYNQWIFDGAGNQAALTAWRYDETALQDAPGITGHSSSYGTGKTVRGNNTSEQHFLDTTSAYLTTQRTYDIAGNTIASKDPRGNTTTYGYNDDGSNHYALVTSVKNALNQHELRLRYSKAGRQLRPERRPYALRVQRCSGAPHEDYSARRRGDNLQLYSDHRRYLP